MRKQYEILDYLLIASLYNYYNRMKRKLSLFVLILLGSFTIFAEADAAITWRNFTDTTAYKSYNLKFGIKAKSQIESFDVIVNNQDMKGLHVVAADGYDMVKTKSVLLNEGANIIEAIVKTANGVSKSKKTIIRKSLENPVITDTVVVDDLDFDELFSKAIFGDPDAQYQLGMKYLKGSKEVDKDLFESSLWFRESAMAGNHSGEYEFACALMEGRGILKNVPLSIRYLKLASEGKHPQSMLKLGICYETGLGVTKDIAKAKELYSKCPLKEAKQRLNTLK